MCVCENGLERLVVHGVVYVNAMVGCPRGCVCKCNGWLSTGLCM